MRAVHVLAVSAVLALGASVAPTAQAQGLLDMSPPADDSSAPIFKPKYDDIRLQSGTALPPKTGSAVFLNGRPTEFLSTTRSGRATARPTQSK